MKKFVLGSDPRTGRRRMRQVTLGAACGLSTTESVRRLPEEPRERLASVLSLFTSAGWRDRQYIEWVRIYGVSFLVMLTAGIPFSILAVVEITNRARDTSNPLLGSDPLWYGTLALLGLSTGLAVRAFARQCRRGRR